MPENRPVLIALGIVVLLLVGAVVWFATMREPEPVVSQPVAVPAPPAPTVLEPEPPLPDPEPEEPALPFVEAVSTEPEPQLEPVEPAFVLPRLDNSDQLIKDGVASLSKHDRISDWLHRGELVRRFVVTVDNVSRGLVPRDQIAMLGPDEPFPVQPAGEEGVYLLDVRGYARYDLLTDVFTSVDARRAAEFFDLVRPLLQGAYTELGYGSAPFEEVVFRAIGWLLETPALTGPIRLTRPVVMYEFEDPKLERLSAVQKQMVRMGPRNTRAIQAKISAFALELRSLRR